MPMICPSLVLSSADRIEDHANRVGVAGPAGDQGDPGVAGEPFPGIGHVDRGRLTAHMHEIELRSSAASKIDMM